VRILYNIEMKAEPDYVICKSPCLLLDLFQMYLEMSIVFGGISIYTATANSCSVGNENVVLGLFWGEDRGGEISNKKLRLRVIAEKMKICSYVHFGQNSYLHDIS